MNNQQLPLFCDSLEEALKAIVFAAGGPKEIGCALWPTKKPAAAAQDLNHCLDPDRALKLSLDEVEFILRQGREVGVHTGMDYLARVCGYETPRPMNPETEKERLQREFIKAVEIQAQLVRQMGVFNG